MFIKVLSNHTFLESIHPELKYGDKSGCHSNDGKSLTRFFAQYDDPHSWSRGKKIFLLFFYIIHYLFLQYNLFPSHENYCNIKFQLFCKTDTDISERSAPILNHSFSKFYTL